MTDSHFQKDPADINSECLPFFMASTTKNPRHHMNRSLWKKAEWLGNVLPGFSLCLVHPRWDPEEVRNLEAPVDTDQVCSHTTQNTPDLIDLGSWAGSSLVSMDERSTDIDQKSLPLCQNDQDREAKQDRKQTSYSSQTPQETLCPTPSPASKSPEPRLLALPGCSEVPQPPSWDNIRKGQVGSQDPNPSR